MEKRYHQLLQLLISFSICISLTNGSPSTSTIPSTSSSSYSSAHLSSSSNDVYPRNNSEEEEEDVRAYRLVEELLTEEDRAYDVKVLPSGREVSTYILHTEVKRLLFPLVEKGPLTITVTPCASPLSWSLTLRLRPSSKTDGDYDSLMKKAWITQSDDHLSSNATQDDEFYYDSLLYDYNLITRDPKLFDPSSVFASYKNSRFLGRLRRRRRRRRARDAAHLPDPTPRSKDFGTDRKKRNWAEEKRMYFKGTVLESTDSGPYPQENPETNRRGQGILQKDSYLKEKGIPGTSKSGGSPLLVGAAREGKVRKRSVRGEEMILKIYEGHESIVFQRQSMPPGLYVLQVRPLWGSSYIHIKAQKDWSATPVSAPVSSTRASSPEGIILRWSPSVPAAGYCLVISEGRSFPSLCAARASREENQLHTVPPPPKKPTLRRRISHRKASRLRRPSKTPMLLMGCTEHNWYRLSNAPSSTLHVAVWEANGIVGPPMGRGVVRPSSGSRAKVPRLRPGELMTLVPSAGGTASVKFKVRKRGRRLHIMAVTCSTQLHLNVKTRHGISLGSATGDPGSLHLVLRNLPQATITLYLKTDPPGAGNSILITAAHTTRTLALPRLPRRAVVRISNITCTSALVKWFKAPGNASYCVLVEGLRSSAFWTERTPRQCGWEPLIEKPWLFVDKWCGQSAASKRQSYKTEALSPGASYSVTVLVRHGVTGRTLAMPPKRIQTPDCKLL
ncbi:protein NDNF-like [Macrobrachium rosenbergii]|uniref:protein NDNF-like n=1 Tax=Macrobrachium rosenbergii TaxID=79674 RepID=UPI0034D5C38F